VTVAAVVLAATPESALADADGVPAVRRIADVAWSGGAVPIVVVAADPDGAVARALIGAPVTLAEPAPGADGPAGQIARGLAVATDEVRGTAAALVWPAGMTWVGPETVTSLIEAHGTAGSEILRPSFDGEAGWPALVPVSLVDVIRATPPDQMPDDVLAQLGALVRMLDLGDPGATHDRATPRAALPPYVGPVDPPGHTHEWGAAIADEPDDGPLEGPALAPYSQAAADSDAG
jgi:CTP:molybdopterin cytidylyltransferase MocA